MSSTRTHQPATDSVSNSRIDIYWTDNVADESAYGVERSLDGENGWAQITSLLANSSSYSEDGLSCGVQYYYRIQFYRAVDQIYSLYSNAAECMTIICTLPVLDNLAVEPISASQIDLTWMDNAADESAYRVVRSLHSLSGWTEISDLPANLSAFSEAGLACGQIYYYHVRTFRENDNQFSAYSSTAQADTAACTTQVYLPLVLTGLP